MKKLILIAVLICFGMSDSIAQTAKSKYVCKMVKVSTPKKVVKTKRVAAKKKVVKPTAMVVVDRVPMPPPPTEPCTGYRKHNIVVMECPGLMFDRQDRLEISSFRNYSGYIRPADSSEIIKAQKALIAPQSPNLNNSRTIAPASGNYCEDCLLR